MGYYTYFTLKASPRKEPLDEKLVEIAEEINRIFHYTMIDDYEINYLKSHNIMDVSFEAKWHSCEEDMIELSKKFPEYLLTLEGKGEDPNDWWVRYFKGGEASEYYIAEITSPQDVAKKVGIKEKFRMND